MTIEDLKLNFQKIVEAKAFELGANVIPDDKEWAELWSDIGGNSFLHGLKEVHNNAIRLVTEETNNLITE